MTFAGKRGCCSTHLWGSHKLRHVSNLVWKLVKGLIFCFLSFKAQFSSVTVSQFLKIDSRRNLESRINWDLTLLTDCQLTWTILNPLEVLELYLWRTLCGICLLMLGWEGPRFFSIIWCTCGLFLCFKIIWYYKWLKPVRLKINMSGYDLHVVCFARKLNCFKVCFISMNQNGRKQI